MVRSLGPEDRVPVGRALPPLHRPVIEERRQDRAARRVDRRIAGGALGVQHGQRRALPGDRPERSRDVGVRVVDPLGAPLVAMADPAGRHVVVVAQVREDVLARQLMTRPIIVDLTRAQGSRSPRLLKVLCVAIVKLSFHFLKFLSMRMHRRS